MKKFIFCSSIIICYLTISFTAKAGNTVTIRPGSESGIDAVVNSLSPDNNYGNATTLPANAWTSSNLLFIQRSYLKFDLSSVPQNILISKVTLHLYNASDITTLDEHQSLTKSNEVFVCKVTSDWQDSTVTWNNQPSIAPGIYVPASTSAHQNYEIDVTSIVKQMLEEPQNNFGFCIKLVTEREYCRVLFGSSDHDDPDIHPMLEIEYVDPVSTTDSKFQFRYDSTSGKDANITSYSGGTSNNYGNSSTLYCLTWSINLERFNQRFLIDFPNIDTLIPTGSVITYGLLELYNDSSESSDFAGKHSGLNDMKVNRIITPWYEDTVTWNSKPDITNENQVIIPQSTSDHQDYKVFIRDIMQDLIDDKPQGHGLMFSQRDERLNLVEMYRRVLLGSSDNPYEHLRPKLTVYYDTSTVVTSVSLNTDTIRLKVGSDFLIAASIVPANARITDVNWWSSDTSIATVTDGKITAVSDGTTYIIVQTVNGGYNDTCVVEVYMPVEGVTMNTDLLTLEVDSQFNIIASVTPSDATNKSIRWSSRDTSIATVSDGTVTGVSIGETYIVVETEEGDFIDSCFVKVAIPVSGIILNMDTLTLGVGIDSLLLATVKPENATFKSVTWTSHDKTVATVYKGTITTVSVGETYIVAKTDEGGFADSCKVIVENYQAYINRLMKSETEISIYPNPIKPGQSFNLQVNFPEKENYSMLRIYNNLGRLVGTFEKVTFQEPVLFDGKPGMYILEIKNPENGKLIMSKLLITQ